MRIGEKCHILQNPIANFLNRREKKTDNPPFQMNLAAYFNGTRHETETQRHRRITIVPI